MLEQLICHQCDKTFSVFPYRKETAKCGFNLLRLTETEINNNSFKEKLDKEVN